MAHRIEDVVARGMCVGCGACSVRTSGAIPITLGRFGLYEADLTGVDESLTRAGDRVCPFSDEAANEDDIADEAFGALPKDAQVGHHLSSYAGRVRSDDDLRRSSSGGLTTWLLSELDVRGRVDGVIHVGRGGPDEPLFGFTASGTVEEVGSRRTSVYYATTMDEVLTRIRGDGRRYAIVGVPCFIRAARLLCAQMPDLSDQLVVFVGIVCGHLKSQFFAESLGWQAGVSPDRLGSVDFRVKNPSRDAGAYDYRVTSSDGRDSVTRATSQAIDGNWGYGAFQPEACNFCDDVFAETADVVLGDAWIPEYESDWRGTNVLVNRDADIQQILQDGVRSGQIDLDPLSVADAARSQAGNFRHRRDGLRVRLADDAAAGLSVPHKRVSPGYDHVSRRRVRIVRQRRRMSRLSLVMFAQARAAGDLGLYLRWMRREVRTYQRIERPLYRRVLSRVRARIRARSAGSPGRPAR